jgi:HEAT repeat protein
LLKRIIGPFCYMMYLRLWASRTLCYSFVKKDNWMEPREQTPTGRLLMELQHMGKKQREQAAETLRGLLNGPEPEMDAVPFMEEIQRSATPMLKAAVKVLQQQGPAAIPWLLMALRHELPGVSSEAARVLWEMAEQVPLAELLELMKHPNERVRESALSVLDRKEQEWILLELLVAALKDPSWRVRTEAARGLARWGNEAPIEPLIEATRDSEAMVRMVIQDTLCKVGQRQADLALEAVLDVLRLPVENPDLWAGSCDDLEALMACASPHVLLREIQISLRGDNGWLAVLLAGALARQGERVPVEELRPLLAQPGRYAREAALEALAGAGPAAPIDEIIEVFRKVPEARYKALETLNLLAEYVPLAFFQKLLLKKLFLFKGHFLFLEAIKRKGERVPLEYLTQLIQAVTSLQDPGPGLFIAELEEFTELAPADQARWLAAFRPHYLIEEKMAARAQPIFARLVPLVPLANWLDLLQAPEPFVRRGTLKLLLLHPERPPREAIVAALSDQEVWVQRAALQTLRALGMLRKPELLRWLQTAKNDFRRELIDALATFEKDAPLQVILAESGQCSPWARVAALKSLGQPGVLEQVPLKRLRFMGGETFAAVRAEVLPLLARRNPQVAVVVALREIGLLETGSYANRNSFQAAWRILQEHAPERLPAIYAEAARVLAGGQPDAVFVSQSLSFLADMLGELGDPQPAFLIRLDQLLSSPHWEARLHATRALGQLRDNLPGKTIGRLRKLHRDPDSQEVRQAAKEALRERRSRKT